MRALRESTELRFETMVDLCGVDYSAYGGTPPDIEYFGSDATPAERLKPRKHDKRFAVVYHCCRLSAQLAAAGCVLSRWTTIFRIPR